MPGSTRAPPGPAHDTTLAQLLAVRMNPGRLIADPPLRPIDLPVDWIVVLEQEERAGQQKRGASTLHERRCCQ